MKLTIEKFVKKELKNLTQFEKYWDKNHIKNPKDFPKSLNAADWHEQYELFLISTKD